MGDPLANRPHALPSGAFTQSDDPSLESSSIKNKGRWGRVPPRSRLSQSESSGAEEQWLSPSVDVTSSYAGSPVLPGALYHRSAHEKAESDHNKCWVPPNGNKALSSSPRSPNTRSYFSSQAGLARGLHQNQPPHQSGRGRNRTSSETEARAKPGGATTQRKRGFSEMERRPMRDKYERSSREWFRHACLRLLTLVDRIQRLILDGCVFVWPFYAYLCIVLVVPTANVSLTCWFGCRRLFFFFKYNILI